LRTPLEAATKPNLDLIARNVVCGTIDPIASGVAPGSDASTFALLGYDPFKVYSGRGALEAEGSGVQVLPGIVALRRKFATVNNDLFVLDRRVGRIAGATISRG
jgi:2,3-bisphosphoglycerate-independent phosphoglycerate mutase